MSAHDSTEAEAGRGGFISGESRFKMTLCVYRKGPRCGKAIPVFTMEPCKG